LEEKKGILEEFVALASTIRDGSRTKDESECNWCQEKIRGL